MLLKVFRRLVVGVALVACAAASVSAQGARDALSTFPDSQAVVFLDTQRLFNEALPRVVPQADLDKFFAEAQKNTSFDLRSIHFVAVGGRFTEPVTPAQPPDFVAVVRGDFNIDGLLALARIAAGDAVTRETYKGRTLDVFDTARMNRPPETAPGAEDPAKPKPPPFPFPQLAATTLDSGTLVFGVPAYVHAAIDAAEGGGRLRADLLELATRNPDNLFSLVGDVPASFAEIWKQSGAPQNEELSRMAASIRQVQFAVSMGANDFGVQSVIKTDTAESARGVSGMIDMGLSFARMGIERELAKTPASKTRERQGMQAALDAVGAIVNAVEGSEVRLNFSMPQTTIAAFVQREMARQKAAQAAKKAAPATPRRRGRRTRRRS